MEIEMNHILVLKISKKINQGQIAKITPKVWSKLQLDPQTYTSVKMDPQTCIIIEIRLSNF